MNTLFNGKLQRTIGSQRSTETWRNHMNLLVWLTEMAATRILNGLTAKTITAETLSFDSLAGNVLLIVNVASACGYTNKNYKELQALHEKYSGSGLKIIGFPCNQFGAQESGTCSMISKFVVDKYAGKKEKAGKRCRWSVCTLFSIINHILILSSKYHIQLTVQFQMMDKIEVNGTNTHPVYQALKGSTGIEKIGWNFAKFLVSKDGQTVKYFKHSASPFSFESEIENFLKA